MEGEADLKFITDFVLHKFNYSLIKGIEVQEVKGKDSLRAFQINFKQSSETKTNLLIFDANGSFGDRLNDLERRKSELSIEFQTFLFPNNIENGDLEILLENIINQNQQKIINCFNVFQNCLEEVQHDNLRLPNRKDKIYMYASLLSSNELAKENKRNYRNADLWNLDSEYLDPLYNFLSPYFSHDEN
ncbi:MAG TPA: DUF3226 domain-containing protein [Cyclobacteriaceae bacterium]|nr:DUF3226 domain-containing protein [Cyclobacteriaceae bacterium]